MILFISETISVNTVMYANCSCVSNFENSLYVGIIDDLQCNEVEEDIRKTYPWEDGYLHRIKS